MILGKDCEQKLFSMLYLCVCPRFVAICVTFNDLCFRTKRCGLLSRIHLWVTHQSWHTGPNDSVLHFELVFVYCLYQIGKLVVVVH